MGKIIPTVSLANSWQTFTSLPRAGEAGGDGGRGSLSTYTCSTCLPSRGTWKNAVNEIILALTWFKSSLAWVRGRGPILVSLRNQGFHFRGLTK